jgi:long-subunit acyl-CoA synthetase (AMP-forming)
MESVKAIHSRFPLEDHSKLFSFLPIAHIAERVLENISIAIGATVLSRIFAKYRVRFRKSKPNFIFCSTENMDQVSRKKNWRRFHKKIEYATKYLS